MSDPVDPFHSTAAHDPHAPAPSDRDEATAAPAPGGTPAPRFGTPAGEGELGTLGPYRVLKELGKGGMGAVYLALDTRLERQLALKVMLPAFAADLDAKGRFLREARAAAKITHDNVVTVYEADERGGVPYIAMQFLQGYPLDQYLKTKGAPPLAHVIRIAREAALGLAAAHQLGLVHRDIKPANLWLEAPNGRVKVLDFGLAKPVGSESELTKSGTMVGTPAYMSPEQARGLKVDHRTDLYSLGAVLYRLCTGKPPFAGEHVMAVLAAVLTDEPTPVRELNPSVPDSLAELIHELLAKKPEARPQTASDVARRLQVIHDQQLPTSPSESRSTRGRSCLQVIHDQQLPTSIPGVPEDPSEGEVAPTSLPVVVQGAPVQSVTTPATVRPGDASAKPGVDNDEDAKATHAQTTPVASRQGHNNRKKGALVAAGVAVLAVFVGATVVSQTGVKREPQPQGADVGTPSVEKGSAVPRETSAPAETLSPTYTNGIRMEFVKVPKGAGWLGGGGGKPGDTLVEIAADFYLGKYEVTQGEWEELMGANPSHFSRNGKGKNAVEDATDADLKRFPVEHVSWDDCQAIIDCLNKRDGDSGWVYRLPKESEWEYACRGGPIAKADSAFDFYFARPTNTLLQAQANFGKILMRTCKVGSYEPNLLGLYDMHGNVWEWCDDATIATGISNRAHRGGFWFNDAAACRAAVHSVAPPSSRFNRLGLRLARVPVGK